MLLKLAKRRGPGCFLVENGEDIHDQGSKHYQVIFSPLAQIFYPSGARVFHVALVLWNNILEEIASRGVGGFRKYPERRGSSAIEARKA